MPPEGGRIMEIFLFFAFVMVVCVGGFYIVVHIIKLWTGLTTEQAITKIQNFFNKTPQRTLLNDYGLIEEIGENVRNIVGDVKFEQLMRLSRTRIAQPLIFFGEQSRLPFIAISTYYSDDNQKQVLEHILSNVVVKYLLIYGYSTEIITEWKIRPDLKMPVLLVQYARNAQEMHILSRIVQYQQKNIIARNSEIIDDTEGDKLDE